ncbi:esterase/lipase family protein [Phaeodactylibacter xiamenensis]|uniref:esterase/lipase family protein n=2 Tax=Phaeodactylibacter xiamenensis TaxID=1524460 RepID=UPI003BAD8441
MKTSLFITTFCILALGSLSAQQQVQIDTTLPPGYVTADYALANLNLNQVPSGLLWENAFPFANLPALDGTVLADSTLVDRLSFELIYATLLDMQTGGYTPPPPQSVLSEDAFPDTITPVKILVYDYHRIKPTAIEDDILQVVSNQLVAGTNFNLGWHTKRRLMASTLWNQKPLEAGVNHFKAEVFSNLSPFEILSIEADFGNGYVSLSQGQTASVDLSTGLTTVTVKITCRNGDLLYSHCPIDVVPGSSSQPAQQPTGPTVYCNPFELTEFPNTDGLTVTGLSPCCDNSLYKPLIVINGFEAPVLGFEYDFDNFIPDMNTTNTPLGIGSVLDELEAEGYDIVFVDFNEGALNSLETNAEIVKDVIEAVNIRKAAAGSSEPNTIIGISMGGVVGKLALLEMERDGETHDAEKFFTFDSPLRGANIPLGYQYLLEHAVNIQVGGVSNLGSIVDDLQQAQNVLSSPSVTQMLLHHRDYNIPSAPFEAFYSKLMQLGALENCEHIAVCNGSQIGRNQGFEAGDEMMGLNFFSFDGALSFGNFSVNAVPDRPSSLTTIYEGRLFYSILIIPIVNSSFRVRIAGNNYLPLDNAPGGFNTADAIELPDAAIQVISEIIPGVGQVPLNPIIHNQFCFIPSVSALEIGPYKGPGQPLGDPFEDVSDNTAVVNNPLTTINRFVAMDNDPDPASALDDNTEHPTLNVDMAGVLLSEVLTDNGLAGFNILFNRIYNFGESDQKYDYQTEPSPVFSFVATRHIIDNSVFVTNNSKICVNKSGLIGFTNNPNNPINSNGSNFDLWIRPALCGGTPVTVTVQNGCSMELGQWDAAAGITNTAQVYVQADATVSIQAQGELYINKDSRFIVQNGGYAEVLSDGLLSAGFGGQVRIEKGGEARIGSGGILRVSQDSKCVVEDGGKLVLEPGAIVQLWDGDDPFGRAVLEVQGELEVQGSIDFSGNGFFDFFQSHILSLTGGIFRIEGRGIGKRFLRLRNNTTLDIGDNTVELLEGLAEYGNYAKISVGQGEAFISNMELKTGGQTAVDLLADGATKIRFVYNEAYGFANAVEAYNT